MHSHHHLAKIRVTVTQVEIEEMWDRYDSGMADRNTSNAVALAMAGRIHPDHQVEVWMHDPKQECRGRIEDTEFSLPRPVFDWLGKAECGIPVNEISFTVIVPSRFMVKPAEVGEPQIVNP